MTLNHILTPQNLKRGYYRRGHSLSVYEVAHTLFLEVRVLSQEGNTTEILKCVDRKQGLFKILTRKAETKVPMTSVILRHTKFPLGCTVRLKTPKPKLLLPPLDR